MGGRSLPPVGVTADGLGNWDAIIRRLVGTYSKPTSAEH
jgi:hypothetical protein